MRRLLVSLIVITAIIATATVPSDAAIKRVASRYNMLNFYGGYAVPVGEYDHIGPLAIEYDINQLATLNADSIYNPTYYLGVDYGTLYSRHVLYMIGFRFTEHSIKDWIMDQGEFNLRQYDIELNANFLFLDLVESPWSPYVGAGVQGGFTTYSVRGFDNDSQLKVAFSLNFGFDLKLMQTSKNKSFVTLASMNNYNLLGTDNRPQYLNLGVGLRYYFR
ncbi:MAG: hypothetical protein ABIJ12_05310 [bacterium]